MRESNFHTLRKALAPRWLTEGDAELVGYAIDLLCKAFVERVRLGHLVRFPQQDGVGTPGPTDALTAMGRDRRVVRGIAESDAAYAVRLITWLTERRTAGNPFTLMRQLAAYCGPGVAFRTVDVRGNWYSRDVNGVQTSILKTANWNWDGDTARWSRFWVIIYPNALWSNETGAWGSGDTWGSDPPIQGLGATASLEHVTTLRAIVADWKPAGTRCSEIILAFDPTSFDPSAPLPDGTWGNWSSGGAGARVASRLQTARYLNGS